MTADRCEWCGCVGYHAEICEGFNVNDPMREVYGAPGDERDEIVRADGRHLDDLRCVADGFYCTEGCESSGECKRLDEEEAH